MVFFEAAVTTVTPGGNAPFAEFQSDGTRRCYVREFGITEEATGSAVTPVQFGRPGNTPTGGAVTLGQALDPGNTISTGGITTTWGTAPTVPSVPLKALTYNNVLGLGVFYVCEPDCPIEVGPTRDLSLVLFDPAGAANPKSLTIRWAE